MSNNAQAISSSYEMSSNPTHSSDNKEKQDLSLKHEFSNEMEYASAEPAQLSFIEKLARSLNAETKGIERVTDEEKTDNSITNAATMWLSANMVIASFALGAIGTPVFGLNFTQATLVIIFFSLLGALPVAFFSVFGIQLGLRQMVLSRFMLGNLTARWFALINAIACIGWGAVNTMVSAQLFHIVNPGGHQCPPWAGCLIIVFSTIIVTFFGYRVIHAYEKWSWVPNFIIFLIIIAQLSKSGNFDNTPIEGGKTIAGGVLSFGGAIYGFATGWTTYAADYTVYMPRNTNKTKVFFAILGGLLFPLYFSMILGAAAVTGINKSEEWNTMYKQHSIGGLVFAILAGEHGLGGFGQFCCVVLAMSTVANNIPNMYSIALSTQSLSSRLSVIPRPVWTICGNLITLAIAIPGYYKFEEFLANFMNIIAYYLAIYTAIALSEHFLYRKGLKNYAPDEWSNWDYLPVGYASAFAFCCGVVGVVIGMDQVWYASVLGRQIGKFGGDIGFELGGAFAFVSYNATRWLELKYVGR